MALLIRRVVVIANPAARRGKRVARQAQAALARNSVQADIIYTERPGHAPELAAHHAPGYDAVFSLGGDGTFMEIAGALSGTQVPIGILAGGTGNLVARALGIPLSLHRAVPVLLEGDVLRMDLGRLPSGRRFAVAAGVGIDSSMIAETPPWLKRRVGVVAYAIIGTRAAIRAVRGGRFFDARVTIDGMVHERRAAAVMIANFGAVLGKRLTLGPEIRTDDGLLDGCIFSPRTLRDVWRIMRRMMRRDFGDDPCLLYCRGASVRVETNPPLPWQADGEMMGTTPFEVVAEPLAVRMLVPRQS